jgi:Mut7-C RNAse domain
LAPPGPSVRFLCDAMLGGLAKWLRAAGYDVYYAREGTDVSDRTLTAKALQEGRVLLTSDGDFLENASPYVTEAWASLWCLTSRSKTSSGSWSNTSGSSDARAAAWRAAGGWTPYPARPSRIGFHPAYCGTTTASFFAGIAVVSSGTTRTGSVSAPASRGCSGERGGSRGSYVDGSRIAPTSKPLAKLR